MILLIGLSGCVSVEPEIIDNFCLWAEPISLTNEEWQILEQPDFINQIPNVAHHLDWYDEEYYNRCVI